MLHMRQAAALLQGARWRHLGLVHQGQHKMLPLPLLPLAPASLRLAARCPSG